MANHTVPIATRAEQATTETIVKETILEEFIVFFYSNFNALAHFEKPLHQAITSSNASLWKRLPEPNARLAEYVHRIGTNIPWQC